MFRKLVRGTRRGYIDKDYNIDLAYICPNRIIVMSYPGSGALQTQIRNDCRDVSKPSCRECIDGQLSQMALSLPIL